MDILCAGTAGGCTHIDISFRSSPPPAMRVRIERDKNLSELTTFKIGGKADYFCRVVSTVELQEALAFARPAVGGASARSLPIFILGGGSNVLVGDDGFRGFVIKIEISGIVWEEKTHQMFAAYQHLVRACAGENWDAFVAETITRGLWGLENLSGIPGTVGGAPVQNIGAYGSEVKNVIEWVEAVDMRTGAPRKMLPEECEFGYRDSIFKKKEGKNYIITRVAFCLRADGTPNLSYKDLAEHFARPTRKRSRCGRAGKPTPTLSEVRRAVLEIRARKFPSLDTHGTAGSFFKNPVVSPEKFAELKKRFPELSGFTTEKMVKLSLAWILDKMCGLKGYSHDGAALWKDQPLVLVNEGGASASDVEALAEKIAAIVKEKTGIEIEREVQSVS